MNWANFEEDQDERALRLRTIFQLMVWAIVIGLTAGLVLYATKASADSFSTPKGEVVLQRHQEPCQDEDILAAIARAGGAHLLHEFKRATLTYGGRNWRSCWIEKNDLVFSFDEEGAPLEPIPANLFTEGGRKPDA